MVWRHQADLRVLTKGLRQQLYVGRAAKAYRHGNDGDTQGSGAARHSGLDRIAELRQARMCLGLAFLGQEDEIVYVASKSAPICHDLMPCGIECDNWVKILTVQKKAAIAL